MSNSDFYDIVNVGSSRLATDGECIRDAFVKINNNSSTVFNTVLDYDTNVLFGGWKLVVGVDNSIVVSNSINVSNSLNVNIATMVANTNNVDLDFNIENNLNLSINNSGITMITDASNNVVLTANSFTSTGPVYTTSITNTANTNNITFNSNDIDISNTFGDININAVTNDINFTGDIVMNTNMFDINVTTGDISIQNGAITIDNSQEINIGINNNLVIDNSNNITFAPTTNIDFSNVVDIDLDFNFINQIDVNFETITNNQVLIYNSTSGNFEAGTVDVPSRLSDLDDVFSDPGPSGDGEILIYNLNNNQYENKKPWLNNFAMTNRDIIPTVNHYLNEIQQDAGYNVGSSEFRYSNMFANMFHGDLSGSVFADDSTLLVDGANGTIPSVDQLLADIKNAAATSATYAEFQAAIAAL